MWLNVYDTLLYCTDDFPSAATASGLPSMYLQYGWKLQGLLQEASLISTISFFINLTEIASTEHNIYILLNHKLLHFSFILLLRDTWNIQQHLTGISFWGSETVNTMVEIFLFHFLH